MNISTQTNVWQLLTTLPECNEFLYPYLDKANRNTTLQQLALSCNLSIEAMLSGIQRYQKRIEQNPCDYQQMRDRLIKPGMVNIAGYTSFLLQNALLDELTLFAKENNIPLNLQLFPKHEKKQFQNYLAICDSPDDLPDLLLGKGFSSLTTARFFDKFIHTGHFHYPLKDIIMGESFQNAGIPDPLHAYHAFGVEEAVMVFDKSVDPSIPVPKAWSDILSDTYQNALTQMGKPGQDHFGFIMMLYLYHEYGEEGIARFASNVKCKQHFTHTVKNMGRKSKQVASVNVMHSFAARFIRSEAQEHIQWVETAEGNPAVCQFLLLKNKANVHAASIAQHMYSKPIQTLLLQCGILPVTATEAPSFRWIGWETLRSLPLPFLKDQLAEIAFNHYQIPTL